MNSTDKNKYKRMSDSEIERLIRARIYHAGLFKQKFYKRNEVWLEIQNTAELIGFSVEQLRVKWIYLFKKYKELLSPPTGISTEDGEETADTWKWFDIMHDFGQTQRIINPPTLISNIPGCSTNNNGIIDDMDYSEVEFLEDDFTPANENAKTPPRPTRKKRKNLKLADIFEKEAKRNKKEGQCMMQFLDAYAKAENIPFVLPDFSDSE